jgi:hypothetical protein
MMPGNAALMSRALQLLFERHDRDDHGLTGRVHTFCEPRVFGSSRSLQECDAIRVKNDHAWV